MKNVGKQIGLFILMVLYLGSSVLLPISHNHILCGSVNGQQTIATHGSGKKELPGPLPLNHTCISCLLASQFVACVPTHIDPATIAPSGDCIAPAQVFHFFAAKFSHQKRGPPHLLV